VLSLVHVLEWRAAVNPDATAFTDHQGAELTYAGLAAATLREPFWAGRDRQVS